MKKVLVTGATGFVGSYVIEALLKNAVSVTASSSNRQKAAGFGWFDKVNYVEFDLRQFDGKVNYFTFFQQPDTLIHLAWEGLPHYTQDFHLTENLPRHRQFLTNILLNGLRDLTVTGTCLEYGLQEGCLKETMPAEPVTAYAIAKDELRKYIEAFQSPKQFSFKWARLFYMYGRGQNPKSLISQLDKAIENNEPVFNMSGGEQVRDFLPVSEMAERVVAVALQQQVGGVINCCSGVPVKVKDFVEAYLKSKNAHLKLNPGYYNYTDYEPMKFWGDLSKLTLLINMQSI